MKTLWRSRTSLGISRIRDGFPIFYKYIKVDKSQVIAAIIAST